MWPFWCCWDEIWRYRPLNHQYFTFDNHVYKIIVIENKSNRYSIWSKFVHQASDGKDDLTYYPKIGQQHIKDICPNYFRVQSNWYQQKRNAAYLPSEIQSEYCNWLFICGGAIHYITNSLVDTHLHRYALILADSGQWGNKLQKIWAWSTRHSLV